VRKRFFKPMIGLLLGVAIGAFARRNYLLSTGAFMEASGSMMNYLAISVNGWKMPSKGPDMGSKNHCRMGTETRHPLLCDIFNIGIGFASMGDFLIVAGCVLVLASYWH